MFSDAPLDMRERNRLQKPRLSSWELVLGLPLLYCIHIAYVYYIIYISMVHKFNRVPKHLHLRAFEQTFWEETELGCLTPWVWQAFDAKRRGQSIPFSSMVTWSQRPRCRLRMRAWQSVPDRGTGYLNVKLFVFTACCFIFLICWYSVVLHWLPKNAELHKQLNITWCLGGTVINSPTLLVMLCQGSLEVVPPCNGWMLTWQSLQHAALQLK